MKIVLQILGVLIILDGIVILIKPALVKTVMGFLVQNQRMYLAAALKAVFGLLFLFGASQCKLPVVAITIGIVGLFGAVIIVVLLEKMKTLISFFAGRGEFFWRLISIIYLAFGALIIYSV